MDLNTGIGTVYGTVLEHFYNIYSTPYCQLCNIKMTVIHNQTVFVSIFIRSYAPILFFLSTLTELDVCVGVRCYESVNFSSSEAIATVICM